MQSKFLYTKKISYFTKTNQIESSITDTYIVCTLIRDFYPYTLFLYKETLKDIKWTSLTYYGGSTEIKFLSIKLRISLMIFTKNFIDF